MTKKKFDMHLYLDPSVPYEAPVYEAICAAGPGRRKSYVVSCIRSALGLERTDIAVQIADLQQRVAQLESISRDQAGSILPVQSIPVEESGVQKTLHVADNVMSFLDDLNA